MASDSPNLNRVRVQTARMLEIFALLRGQLGGEGLQLTPQQREQLTQSIWTIAGNMQELQDYLAAALEDSSRARSTSTPSPTSGKAGLPKMRAAGTSPTADEADLDNLLEAVLRWVAETEGGG